MKILDLFLETSNLEELYSFYHVRLGFPVLLKEENQFAVKVGSTCLSFKETADLKSEPFYHFAINLPENRLSEALEWAEERVDITLERGEKVIDFKSWNAHSFYFEDPAGNIIEIIARHNLEGSNVNGPFQIGEFERIDEIGIPVSSVLQTIEQIKSELGLENWQEASETFAPIGDELGLFIFVKTGRIWYMSDKEASEFPLKVVIGSNKTNRVKYGKTEIISVKAMRKNK